MNKTELVEKIAQDAGLTKADAARSLDALIEAITTAVKKGQKVAISGLGIFEKKHRAARTGVNPATQQTIKIPAKNVPTFKAAKNFKDLVK